MPCGWRNNNSPATGRPLNSSPTKNLNRSAGWGLSRFATWRAKKWRSWSRVQHKQI